MAIERSSLMRFSKEERELQIKIRSMEMKIDNQLLSSYEGPMMACVHFKDSPNEKVIEEIKCRYEKIGWKVIIDQQAPLHLIISLY